MTETVTVRPISRWKAAGIHSCISAAIGLILGALLFLVWYPPPFFHAAGGLELMLLLVGVDLAIGPLLTCVVFRQGKPGLLFDLTVIAVLQAAALIYGIVVVLEARPVFLVAAVDRLVLVSANEVADADLLQGSEPRFRSRSWTGPRLVAAQMPTDPTERTDLIFSGLAGRDLQNLPKYYRDYCESSTSLLKKAKSVDQLFSARPKDRATVEAWLTQVGRSPGSVVWVPLQASKEDLVMVLDARTAEPLRAFAIDPW